MALTQARKSYRAPALFFLLWAVPAAAQPQQEADKTAVPAPTASDKTPAASAPAASAPAASAPADNTSAKKAAPLPHGVSVERTASGQKLFRINEGLVVEGQRQKPNAFYVLERANTPYDWEALDESFLTRILKAAERPPF
jgi:hypothetical protein